MSKFITAHWQLPAWTPESVWTWSHLRNTVLVLIFDPEPPVSFTGTGCAEDMSVVAAPTGGPSGHHLAVRLPAEGDAIAVGRRAIVANDTPYLCVDTIGIATHQLCLVGETVGNFQLLG